MNMHCDFDMLELLVLKIGRCERDLRNVHWIFLVGLGVMLLGVFILRLVVAHVTLFTIGRTRFVLDPIAFGIWGVFFIVIGFVCLIGSVYVKIRYPTKVKNFKENLQKLDNILMYQQGFQRNLGKI